MNDDLNGRQSRDWDEVKNENLSFFARSNENKKLKERAMPRRATTIFSEVRSRGEKAKSTRLFVAAVRPNPLRNGRARVSSRSEQSPIKTSTRLGANRLTLDEKMV